MFGFLAAQRWICLSAFLLIVYLGFFHVCLMLDPQGCTIAGAIFWLVWLLITVTFRKVFINRFEFWIHQLVGVDILFEGFNPFHAGFGFYFCALSFWLSLIHI